MYIKVEYEEELKAKQKLLKFVRKGRCAADGADLSLLSNWFSPQNPCPGPCMRMCKKRVSVWILLLKYPPVYLDTCIYIFLSGHRSQCLTIFNA